KDLRAAIMDHPHLSKETKTACLIYLSGHDNRAASETISIGKIALASLDLDMFGEAMRRAPKEAREFFLHGDGQQLLRLAGHSLEQRHLQDYATYGKLSERTQVTENTSWLGDNEDAIEHSLATMSENQRLLYKVGRAIEEKRDLPDLARG